MAGTFAHITLVDTLCEDGDVLDRTIAHGRIATAC